MSIVSQWDWKEKKDKKKIEVGVDIVITKEALASSVL